MTVLAAVLAALLVGCLLFVAVEMGWLRPKLAAAAVGLMVVAALLVVGLGGGGGSRPAPALPTQSLHQPKVTVGSLRGRPYLVNFWASWCPPCEEEAPDLARFADAGRGVRLVGVDLRDDAKRAQAFIDRYRWNFPILSDRDGAVAADWSVQGLPTTLVVDRRGQIVKTLNGPQTAASLAAAYPAVAGR
jgi:DsbE subfamily thiol:disulfide oxidoreductase